MKRAFSYDEDDQIEPIFKKVKERSCTDFSCCFLLVVMIVVLAAVAVFSLINGDINYILYPSDYLGQFCGSTSGVKHLEKGYFPRLDQDIKTFLPLLVKSPFAIVSFRPYILCVDSCPPAFSLENPQKFGGPGYPGAAQSNLTSPSFYNLRGTETAHKYCLPTTKLEPGGKRLLCGVPHCNNQTLFDVLDPLNIPHPNCTVGVHKILSNPEVTTAWVVNEQTKPFCDMVVQEDTVQQFLPDDGDDPQTLYYERLFASNVQAAYTFFESVYGARQQVLMMGMGAPLVFIGCWFVFLFFFAGTVIWLAITLFFGAMLASCVWLYSEAGVFSLDEIKDCAQRGFDFTNCTLSMKDQPQDGGENSWYLAAGFIANILLVIYLLMVYLYRRKVSRAIAIVREVTRVFWAIPGLTIYPLVEMFSYFALVIYFFTIGGYIVTQGTSVWDDLTDSIDGTLGANSSRASVVSGTADALLSRLDGLSKESQVALLFALHCVGFIWGLFLIHACYYTTIAGVVARWFFGHRKDDKPKRFGCGISVIWLSAWAVFSRHLGSMAFGSLIMTIIWIVRVALAFLEARTKSVTSAEGRCSCLLNFCLKCVFRVVDCLYKTVQAISEYGYISIAIEGCDLCMACGSVFDLLARQGAQVAMNKIVGSILSMIISFSIPTVCALICFAWVRDEGEYTPIWPAITVWLTAFLVASGVTEIFRCAIDTIFVAAYKDLDKHGDPMYMSEGLRRGFNLPTHSQEGVILDRPSDVVRPSSASRASRAPSTASRPSNAPRPSSQSRPNCREASGVSFAGRL